MSKKEQKTNEDILSQIGIHVFSEKAIIAYRKRKSSSVLPRYPEWHNEAGFQKDLENLVLNALEAKDAAHKKQMKEIVDGIPIDTCCAMKVCMGCCKQSKAYQKEIKDKYNR